MNIQQQIIHFLRNAEHYISGEEISRSLKISRSAIWKYIQDLRENGYDIVAVPHLGYKLNTAPDTPFPDEIRHGLKTKFVGHEVHFFETTASTMDEAFQLGLKGCAEGTVVCAEHQTKGRGRLARSWVSPKAKGIYLSVVLRPKLPPTEVAKLTLLSAVAVAEAIRVHSGLDVFIKWPNDLLIKNRKVVGILTELNAETDRVKFIVIGIGVNVNAALSQLPEGATSLKAEADKDFSRVELIREILRQTEMWYLKFQKEGFGAIAQRWRQSNATLNKRIRITEPKGFSEGQALDIENDGGLLIRMDSGVVVKKLVGDVTIIR